MQVFITVVDQGGLSAAGRRLGLAPSVVSDRLSGLERRLGVTLLKRTTRSQTLTDAGDIYLKHAHAIVADIAEMEAKVAAESALPRGLLRITAPSPIGRRRIGPFVGRFASRHPDVNVHLTLEDRLADIVGEGFDIAIRGGWAPDSSLKGRRLFETRRVVVASPAYLHRHKRPDTPGDLVHHSCLVFSSEPHLRAEWRFGRGAKARSYRVSGSLACTNWELPIIWALQDQGLAQKSWWEVSEHVERGELETVLEAFEPDPVAFFAIHPVSVSQSAKNALFIDELLSDFRADPLP
jgi:LysR family transcriptional regulator, transcriptional activator for dmlA